MSKVSEDKRFSAASAATLGQLEGLDERFGAMTSAADAIEALLDAGSVPAARLVEATPHSLLGEPLDSSIRPETEVSAGRTPGSGATSQDFTGSRLTSGATDADVAESVDRAAGSAEDVLRVL